MIKKDLYKYIEKLAEDRFKYLEKVKEIIKGDK